MLTNSMPSCSCRLSQGLVFSCTPLCPCTSSHALASAFCTFSHVLTHSLMPLPTFTHHCMASHAPVHTHALCMPLHALTHPCILPHLCMLSPCLCMPSDVHALACPHIPLSMSFACSCSPHMLASTSHTHLHILLAALACPHASSNDLACPAHHHTLSHILCMLSYTLVHSYSPSNTLAHYYTPFCYLAHCCTPCAPLRSYTYLFTLTLPQTLTHSYMPMHTLTPPCTLLHSLACLTHSYSIAHPHTLHSLLALTLLAHPHTFLYSSHVLTIPEMTTSSRVTPKPTLHLGSLLKSLEHPPHTHIPSHTVAHSTLPHNTPHALIILCTSLHTLHPPHTLAHS